MVLNVTRILIAALTKFRVYVCMYVCNYSSQTTEPICIKIIPAKERLTLIAIGYLDLKYLPNTMDNIIVPESAVAQAYLRHWQRIDYFNDVTE